MNIKAMLAVVLFLMIVVGIILGAFFFPYLHFRLSHLFGNTAWGNFL